MSQETLTTQRTPGVWRFWVYSAIGIAMFFVPITVEGKSSIPLDHLVAGIRALLGPAVPWVILGIIAVGAARPFITGRWRASLLQGVFAFLGVGGLLVAISLLLGFAPPWVAEESTGPFLFNSLVVPVGILVPVGAVFLALLMGYGLMEFTGVLVQRIMRPIWRTPGRSAVDAVASFVGSYSIGLLITNRMYLAGKYTGRESAIIATGFSTVSVTFLVVVATTLELMDRWLLFFFVTLFVTFAVTAITAYLPPLSRLPDEYIAGVEGDPEQPPQGSRIAAAWAAAKATLAETPALHVNLWRTFKEGFLMAAAILPSILSVGLLGLLAAKHTPIFDWFSYLFLPFTWITQLPDPQLAAKAISLGIVEMFLPAVEIAGNPSDVLRFTVGVVSVAGVIFFSALVPSILATRIPIGLGTLIVVWIERVILSILITAPIAHLLL